MSLFNRLAVAWGKLAMIVSKTQQLGSIQRGEEQNREEREMAQTKLGGGRNRGGK